MHVAVSEGDRCIAILASHLSNLSRIILPLEVALTTPAYYIELIEVLIEPLGGRRKQLVEMTIGILPAEKVKELHVARGQMLNEHTSDVCDAPVDVGIVIPTALCSHFRELSTVFHNAYLNCEVAARLFDTRFHDIDGYDARGSTPLMTLRFNSLFYESSYPSLFS